MSKIKNGALHQYGAEPSNSGNLEQLAVNGLMSHNEKMQHRKQDLRSISDTLPAGICKVCRNTSALCSVPAA